MGVEMKKLLIAMGILLMLFAFASCNNDNQSLDGEVATTVAEELKPRELVEKVLRDGDREGVDISYDLREAEKGAKPSYTHTLSVTIVFSGYEYSRVLTIESGRLTYIFYGTMSGSRFTSRAYELRTEEAMAVSGTSEGTVDVELSIDASEGASGTSYGVTLTTDEEGRTVAEGSPSVSVTIPDDAVLSVGGTETKIPEEENDPPYVPSRGEYEDYFASGNGTSGNPYKISSVSELTSLSTLVREGNSMSGYYFEQTVDLDLSEVENWLPIGGNGLYVDGKIVQRFCGSYDGAEKRITNLTINISDKGQRFVGLFGSLGDGASITDLKISGNVTATKPSGLTTTEGRSSAWTAGMLVGNIEGNGISISGIEVSGTVNGERAAGIAGEAEGQITIISCINNCTVTGTLGDDSGAAAYGGGIVGSTAGATIEKCTNNGSISSSHNHAGGIAGTMSGGAIIRECVNEEMAEISSMSPYSGGIVGKANGSFIYSSENKGAVKGKSTYNGGIAGYAEDMIIDGCSNVADISQEQSILGGIVGTAISTTITDSFNSGDISGSSSIGGIAGELTEDSSISFTENEAVGFANTGTIKGSAHYAGGIVGSAIGNSKIVNADNNGTVTGSGYLYGGIVGYLEDSCVMDSDNSANITITNTNERGAGGIVGSLSGGQILRCDNSGNVSTDSYYAGGLVGKVFDESNIISDSTISCAISSGKGGSGGIVGAHAENSSIDYVNITLDESVTLNEDKFNGLVIGQVLGTSSASFQNCSIKGTILSEDNPVKSSTYIGAGMNNLSATYVTGSLSE